MCYTSVGGTCHVFVYNNFYKILLKFKEKSLTWVFHAGEAVTGKKPRAVKIPVVFCCLSSLGRGLAATMSYMVRVTASILAHAKP